MFQWLTKKGKSPPENSMGETIETEQTKEISKIRDRLRSNKKVPKSPQEADKYWKDLSRLSSLLIQLNNLPATSSKKSEAIISGSDVPPFCDDERWHLYRWCRVKMAQQLQRERKFKTALSLWSEIAIIDDLKLAFEEKIYLDGLANCVKRGKISESDAQKIFSETASSFSKCDPEIIWNKISNNIEFMNNS